MFFCSQFHQIYLWCIYVLWIDARHRSPWWLWEASAYEKKKACPNGTGLWLSNGDPPGTRTRDTLIKSQVLYQLS